MIYVRALTRWLAAGALLGGLAPAHADVAGISGLTDVSFGLINAPTDQSRSQSVTICSYQNGFWGWFTALPYSVVATGSGSGGAFTLSSGAATLAYDVQWSDAANRTTGTMLQPGLAAGGFVNAAAFFACRNDPDNASLIITIRAAQLTSARAGNYAGSLSIMITPE